LPVVTEHVLSAEPEHKHEHGHGHSHGLVDASIKRSREGVRAVLLSLAVPALIWDRDQRGMHDRFTGLVLRRV
jgi:hypothetical protein